MQSTHEIEIFMTEQHLNLIIILIVFISELHIVISIFSGDLTSHACLVVPLNSFQTSNSIC